MAPALGNLIPLLAFGPHLARVSLFRWYFFNCGNYFLIVFVGYGVMFQCLSTVIPDWRSVDEP